MFTSADSLTNYLFNFLFMFMIIFVGALVRDITDTIRNKTEIRIFSSAINSLVCTIILVIVYELKPELSFNMKITVDFVVGLESELLARFFNRLCNTDKIFKILVTIFIKDNDVRTDVIDIMLDQEDKKEKENKEKNKPG